MSINLLFLILSFIGLIACLFLALYILVSHVDLQQNFLGPIEHSNRVNQVVLIEVIAHYVVMLFMLFSFQIIGFLIMIPVGLLNAHRWKNGSLYFLPTFVFPRMPVEQKLAMGKLVSYFIVWIYNLIKIVLYAVN
eukprot:gnl/Dysnectes_brevis/4391_a5881_1029.p1 GENE.gnl/Dysnectes_brevis/4391_a5881_1029~~gnl/Dysnectes_brevis/4391_a5881_1029.p1  ORF type:complete len:135 (-),score=0.22 gnl/Dysnectes_brevis/4391_a5881_1029:35-439(-)